MPNDRWLTAIHEAGHAVAGWAQGGAPLVVEIRNSGGRVQADGLDRTAMAFTTAAGPVAEELLADVPPPEYKPPARLCAAFEPASEFVTETVLAKRNVDASGPSDAQALAVWAISGIEEYPERWAGRVAWAKSVAASIIAEHREAVLRLAEALYHNGTLFQDQILTILERVLKLP